MITRQIRVWGRVQGVGFRFFTQQLAIQLDLCAVARFIERVKASTSPYGRVDRYEESEVCDAPLYTKFQII